MSVNINMNITYINGQLVQNIKTSSSQNNNGPWKSSHHHHHRTNMDLGNHHIIIITEQKTTSGKVSIIKPLNVEHRLSTSVDGLLRAFQKCLWPSYGFSQVLQLKFLIGRRKRVKTNIYDLSPTVSIKFD